MPIPDSMIKTTLYLVDMWGLNQMWFIFQITAIMQVKFLPTIVSLVFRKLGFPWVVLLATGTLAVTFEGLSNLVIGDNTIYIKEQD